MTAQQRERLANARPVNPEAHDWVLQGREHWSKFSNPELRTAISYFQRAIAIDPNYAVAYAGLADCYHELTDAPPKEVFAKARAAAEKALQLDPGLAEAYSALGWVEWNYDWNWLNAERDFLHAIDLNPNYGIAHGMYAEFLDSMGRFEEAANQRTLGMQLGPPDPIGYLNIAEHLTYTRDYDRAIENCSKALALDPGFSFAEGRLAQLYWLKGMQEEGLKHQISMAVLQGNSELAGRMESAHRGAGLRAAIRVQLAADESLRKQGKWVSLVNESWYMLLIGDDEHALATLDKAVQERDLYVTSLAVDPLYDKMRSNPRFIDILKRIGLQN
jgi:tetratricopeptide (TPR) repeat protein